MKSHNHRMHLNGGIKPVKAGKRLCAMTPHIINSVMRSHIMKRIHVIAISVLIGFISGVAVAPAKAATLSLQCETIAPYAGNVISVSTGDDLQVGGASFENEPIDNDSTFSGSNPLSTVKVTRAEGGGWFLVVQSRVSDRTISAHCEQVE